jgi:hypothetical protein
MIKPKRIVHLAKTMVLDSFFELFLIRHKSRHIGRPSMATKGHPTNTANPMENIGILT